MQDKAGQDDENKLSDKNTGKCMCCGGDRHQNKINGTKFGSKENCPAMNATCYDCEEVGHFSNMPKCRLKREAT